MRKELQEMVKLFDRMMVEINHGNTAWSAETIRLMNEAPAKAAAALLRPEEMTLEAIQRSDVTRTTRRYHDIFDWNALEWAGAMAGEAGETANKAKKLLRLPHWDVRCARLREEVADEIGDTIHYAVLLAERIEEDLGDAVARVFNRKSEEHGFPERMKRNGELEQEQEGS